VLIGSTQTIGDCQPFAALPPSVADTLAKNIAAKSFSSEKLAILASFAANNSLGFTPSTTVLILRLFTFSNDVQAALGLIQKFVLGLNSSDCVAILNVMSFSSDKLASLRLIVGYVMDLQTGSARIIDAFAFSSDKQQAQQIINAAKVRSCLWGELILPRFDFIIDVSGSMNTKFTTPEGQTLTRLQFVQQQLATVMNGSLTTDQKFNIIQFSDSASAWQPGVVPVNRQNLASASTYVSNLRANGGTYVLNAIKLSINDTQVMGVYLLSDGEPNDSPSAIIAAAQKWGKPVNTIAFKAEPNGVTFLSDLAKATNGIFKAFK